MQEDELVNNTPLPNSLFRSGSEVMNLNRMGSMHQSRISFSRRIVRKIAKESWHIFCAHWEISQEGYGTVIYQVETPNRIYQLVIFTDHIEDEERNDRVVAEKWDCTFTLIEGTASEAMLLEMKNNVPLQEKGRNIPESLVLARANKSVRVFDHIVERLAEGSQPDVAILAEVGYILRTTAVYGNGKFGIKDFEALHDNPDFSSSFSAQMCAVYLLKQFSLDWVHYLAKERGSNPTTLHPQYQKFIGTGNATGLGMAPYLIRHPRVFDNWMYQRELALAEVLALTIDSDTKKRMQQLLEKAQKHVKEVITIDEAQRKKNQVADTELTDIIASIDSAYKKGLEWNYLVSYLSKFDYEAQEITYACLIDLCPHLVDKHENQMNMEDELLPISNLHKEELIQILQERYKWAIDIDFDIPDNTCYFWYASENKEEPRLGERNIDKGHEEEFPLDIARQVNTLYQAIISHPAEKSLIEFLIEFPNFRTIIRRVYTMGQCELGDIQTNIIGKEMFPMNLLRAKLAILGATKFDPRSDRWVRVTFFQGAPTLDHISEEDWSFPNLPII